MRKSNLDFLHAAIEEGEREERKRNEYDVLKSETSSRSVKKEKKKKDASTLNVRVEFNFLGREKELGRTSRCLGSSSWIRSRRRNE